MTRESDGAQGLDQLARQLEAFVEARDRVRFNSPKNLSMALAGEVGELIEHFQWLTQEQSSHLSSESHEAVCQEIADVQIYLLLLARKLDIDPLQAARDRLQTRSRQHPDRSCESPAPG